MPISKISCTIEEGPTGVKSLVVHFSSGKKRYAMDLYSFLYYSKALTSNPYLSENDKIRVYPKINYNEDRKELYCANQLIYHVELIPKSKGEYHIELFYEHHRESYKAFALLHNQHNELDSRAITGMFFWQRKVHILDLLLEESSLADLINVLNHCKYDELSNKVIKKVSSSSFDLNSLLTINGNDAHRITIHNRFILNILTLIDWDEEKILASKLCSHPIWTRRMLECIWADKTNYINERLNLTTFIMNHYQKMDQFANIILELMLQKRAPQRNGNYFIDEKIWDKELFRSLLLSDSYHQTSGENKLKIIHWLIPYIKPECVYALKDLSLTPAIIHKWVLAHGAQQHNVRMAKTLFIHHPFAFSRWILNALLKPNEEFDLALKLIKTVPADLFQFDWEAFAPFKMVISNDRAKLFRCMDERTTLILTAAGLSPRELRLFNDEINLLWSGLESEKPTQNTYRHFNSSTSVLADTLSWPNILDNYLKMTQR